MIRKRLYKLVKALAGDDNEIVGNWFIGNQIIDSISIINGEVVMCIWGEDDLEHQIFDNQLSKDQLLDLIEQLEDILKG